MGFNFPKPPAAEPNRQKPRRSSRQSRTGTFSSNGSTEATQKRRSVLSRHRGFSCGSPGMMRFKNTAELFEYFNQNEDAFCIPYNRMKGIKAFTILTATRNTQGRIWQRRVRSATSHSTTLSSFLRLRPKRLQKRQLCQDHSEERSQKYEMAVIGSNHIPLRPVYIMQTQTDQTGWRPGPLPRRILAG